MNNSFFRLIAAGGLLVSVAVFGPGCDTCKPGRPGRVGSYTISVILDPSLGTNSVIVDLVGANPSLLDRLKNEKVAAYFDPNGDALRKDAAPQVLNFVSGALTQELSITNKIWEQWKKLGVTHVVVLADLGKPDEGESYRSILELDRCHWLASTKELRVEVQPSGLQVLTPTRAAK